MRGSVLREIGGRKQGWFRRVVLMMMVMMINGMVVRANVNVSR